MGRNKGEKNIMRTPEEKERIIFDYFNSGKGAMEFERDTGVSRKSLWKWMRKYSSERIHGSQSRTGKYQKTWIDLKKSILANNKTLN